MEKILPLENVMDLRDSLKENGWFVTLFPFTFNQIRCAVYFERLPDNRPDPIYIAKITFVKDDKDVKEEGTLTALANRNGIDLETNEIKQFFEVPTFGTVKSFFTDFYGRLNNATPTFVTNEYQHVHATRLVRYLSIRDHEDPNAIYCYDVRRNGTHVEADSFGRKVVKNNHRSLYNSDKTHHLRPKLYGLIKNDTNLSCFFSANPSDEKSEVKLAKIYYKRLTEKSHE